MQVTATGADIDFAVLHANQLVQVGEGASGPRRGAEQGTLDVVRDGALVASHGTIVDVGPTSAVAARYDLRHATTVEASGKVVLPGLVDAHTHPLFAGLRYAEYAERLRGAEMAEIEARGGGIWRTVQQTRAAGEEELRTTLRRHFDTILRSGTTTVEAKSGYGQTVDTELTHLRLIGEEARATPLNVVPTFLGAHILPAEQPSAERYTDLIVDELLPKVKEQGIARFSDTDCGSTFGPALAQRIITRAAELGLRSRVHADGSKVSGGWELAVRNRAASADHLTALRRAQIEATGPTDTVAVLLPMAELRYLWPRADARAFIDVGVPVAIASDFSSSIYAPSLFHTIAFAAPWYRLTPEEVISAVTVNAAHSLGVLDHLGTLEPGKQADLLIAGVEDYRMLVFESGVPLVDQVIVGGRAIAAPAGG